MKKGIVLLLCLLLVGCGGFQRGTVKVPGKPINVRTGTEGLVMEFLRDTPPAELRENEVFIVGLKLQNKGAEDIEHGFLNLVLENEYIQLLSWGESAFVAKGTTTPFITFSLEGKSQLLPKGAQEVQTVSLKSKPFTIEQQLQTHPSVVRATACYGYKTRASDTICVDTDPHNLRQAKRKVCEVKDLSYSSQGAPVAITKVEVKMLLGEDNTVIPQLKIFVRNKGKGQVVNQDRVEDFCKTLEEKLEFGDIGKITIDHVSIGDKSLDCQEKELLLSKDKDHFTCRLKQGLSPEQATFTTDLSIQLSYGYTQTISASTLIRKTPG